MECSHCNFCIKTDSMSSCSTNYYLSNPESQAMKGSQLNTEHRNTNNHGKSVIISSNLRNNRVYGNDSVHTYNATQGKSNIKEDVSNLKTKKRMNVKLNVSRIPVLKNSIRKCSVYDRGSASNSFNTKYQTGNGDAGIELGAFQNRAMNEIFCVSVKNMSPNIFTNTCQKGFDSGGVEEPREKNEHRKSRKFFTLNDQIVRTTSLDSFKASEGSERLAVTMDLNPPSNSPMNLNSSFDQQVLCRRSHSDFEYEKLLGNIRKIKTKDKLTTLFGMVSEIERNSLIGQTFISELQILISIENDQEVCTVVDMDEMEILLPNYSVDIIISKVYKVNKHDSSNIISHYVNEIKELMVTKNIKIYPTMKTFLANIFCSHREAEVRFLAVDTAAYQFWNENRQANKSGLDRKSVQSLKELLVQLIHTKEVLFQSELGVKGLIERYIETEKEEDKEELVKALSVHQQLIETALRSTDEFATNILSQKLEELIRNLKESQNAVSSLLIKNDHLSVQNAELMDRIQFKGKRSSLSHEDDEVQLTDKNERLRERTILVQKRLHAVEEKLSKSEEYNASLLDKLLVLRSQLDSEQRSAQSTQANLQLEIACIKRINTGRESALRQASAAGDGLLKDISRIEQSLIKAGKKIQLLPEEMLVSCSNSFIDFVTTCRSCIKVLSQELISTLDTVSGLKTKLDIVTVDNTYANQDIKDLTGEIAQLKNELLKLQHGKSGDNENICVQNSSDLALPPPTFNSHKKDGGEESEELIQLKDTNKDLERKLSLVEKRCGELTQEIGVVYKEKESLMTALQESESKVQSSERIFRELQQENKKLIENNENLTEKLVAAMNLLAYSKTVVENLNKRKTAGDCSSESHCD